jgi:ferritin-like metal-binding protein YciE
MDSLKDLYLHEIKDLHSACTQSRDCVIDMEKAATHAELKDALHKGHKGISDGIEMLSEIAKRHGGSAEGSHCKATEGLVAEARAHAIDADIADPDVRDAAIIAQYQRQAHYAIAGYGTIKAFAHRLGLKDDVETIDENLAATYHGDEKMTHLAQGGINSDAAA